MVKRITILFLLAWRVEAAQTVVKQELFIPVSSGNVIPLTSTNTDQFSSIGNGVFPIIAIGATTNSQPDSGWSAEVRKSDTRGLINSAPAWGAWGAWFKFNQFAVNAADQSTPDNINNSAWLMWLASQSNGARCQVNVGGGGTLFLKEASGGTVTCGQLTLNQWTWIQLAYHTYQSGSWYEDVQLYTMVPGGSLTFAGGITNSLCFSQIVSTGIGGVDISIYWSGRISGVTLCSVDSFSDVAYPTATIAPTASRAIWFVNQSTGSDLSSGLNGAPWKTLSKVSDELRYGGVMGSVSPWVMSIDGSAITNSIADSVFLAGVTNGTIRPNGDMILLDASGGAISTTNTIYLSPSNQGVEIGSTNGNAVVESRKLLSGFTQYDAGTYPKIWQVSDTDTRSTVFEDGKWMNNPIGANIAAVADYLNTTNGSFFSDASKVYFSAFDGSDPNSNGKDYRRSQKLLEKGVAGYNPAIHLTGSNVFVHDITFHTGPYRNQSSGDVDATYVMQNISSGRTVVMNVDLFGGGNHAYGATDGDSTMKRWLINSTAEQCAPWTPNSIGHNNCVEFAAASAAGNRCAYFINVDVSKEAVIGSASGVSTNGSWYAHGANSSGQYDVIQVVGGNGYLSMNEGIVKSGGFLIDRSHLINLTTGDMPNVIVSNTRVDGPLFGANGATVSNSVINRNDDLSQNYRIDGTWSFSNCTFDATHPAVSQIDNAILKTHATTPITLNLSNCVAVLTQDANNICWVNYKDTDTVTSDQNVIVPNPAGNVMHSATSKTFAQWQALGHDTHSSTNNPCFGPGYRPYAKTPCWTTGAELGPATDITGKLFQSRKTCGAYEFSIPEL